MNRSICFASTRVSWSGQVGGWRDVREGWGWVPHSEAMLGAFLGLPAMSRGGRAGQRASMLTVEGKEPSKGFWKGGYIYLFMVTVISYCPSQPCPSSVRKKAFPPPPRARATKCLEVSIPYI